jgi:hypothetical protein
MNRGTCAALALLLAIPSIASAQRADATAGAKPGAAAEKKTADAAPAKKPTTRKGAKAKEPETPAISPQARSLARRTKSIFIFAADACTRAGNRCDPTLRDDAELRFMSACGACNTGARCEAERDAVIAGNARASKDPCAP